MIPTVLCVWTERNAAFDAGTIDVRVNAYV